MASISIGRYAEEFTSFGSDIDLNAEAKAGGGVGHPNNNPMTILIMGAGSGGLVLGIGGTSTITLTDLAAGDVVSLRLGAHKILGSGTSIAKCRVTWG